MIPRELSPKILDAAGKLPIVAITGPRQSGKTTLARSLFPDYYYANLEYPDVRTQALEDPRLFLTSHKEGMIIDEAQRAPELFSYLQGIVDEAGENGRFVLSGSQNFLLMEKISQSLAGRVALFNLLPFTLAEIESGYGRMSELYDILFKGCYPRLYDKKLEPLDWYPHYISTYLEMDVRQLGNIHDLNKFHTFLRLCAGRVGQVFNASAIANELAMNYKTVQSWLSVLQASYIIFLLPPYFKNFNKRLTKSPKIYFYDTGLVCSLLGLKTKDELMWHYLKGEIFETMVISELKKYLVNHSLDNSLYFFRDNNGNEVDCIIDTGNSIKAVEIKAGMTITGDHFKGLKYWQQLSGDKAHNSFLIYGGTENQVRTNGNALGWQNLRDVFTDGNETG